MEKKYTVVAIIGFIIVIGMFFRINTLHERIESPVRFVQSKEQSGIQPEDKELFEKLRQNGLISSSPDNQLIPKPPDFILIKKAREAENPGSSKYDSEKLKKKSNVLKKLYASKAGQIVRNQIMLWNATRSFAAIRDNRSKKRQHDRLNNWLAGDPKGMEWNFHRTGKLVPESFGYVNNGKLLPNFNDWRAVYTDEETITFHTTVTLDKPGKLVVQVIGKPDSPKPEREHYFCPPRVQCSPDKSMAYKLIYDNLKKGANPITIRVQPVRTVQKTIEGLCIRMDEEKNFTWINRERRSNKVYHRFKITTSDDVDLTDENGEPAPAAEKLGLIPLVGMGRKTPFTLYDVLSRSGLPAGTSEIKLTIDSNIQETTRNILLSNVEKLLPKNVNDPYKDKRRATVVILNADTGAILAATQRRTPPKNVHPWDIASFRKIYPEKDPMLVRAWQGLDKHNAPGSTFKTVTSLAALKEAENNITISEYIEGYSRKNFTAKTGLSLNCGHYDPYGKECYASKPKEPVTISNFSVSNGYTLKMSDYLRYTPVLGLTGAVQESANIWFVRLAQIMDGEKALAFEKDFRLDHDTPLPDFRLAETAKKLGFGKPIHLLSNLPSKIELFPCLPKKGRTGGVIYGQSCILNIANKDILDSKYTDYVPRMLWILSQNSIGQGVSASPLQMARVAASVYSGQIIRPYLLTELGGKNLKPPEREKLDIDTKKLKTGMKNVVKEGTASGHIKQNRERYHAKTGTAEVKRNDIRKEPKEYNSVWLTGWYEAKNGKKYAFCCMVTHAWSRDKNTGGEVCGPIVEEIMAKIDKN
jgi:cell division protein FtsI/penicillin-binding protein 2